MARKRAKPKGSPRRKAARKAAGTRAKKSGTTARKKARKTSRAASRKPARTARRPSGRPRRAGARPKPRSAAGRRRRTAARPKPARQTPPSLTRTRRALAEEPAAAPPSSLDFDRSASGARTGRAHLSRALHEHTETGPALTGGDVDADWENAYSSGESAPGGDMPTPDQDRVEDLGRSAGVRYQDNEPLKSTDKIVERDRHRWELDPASSDDYVERTAPDAGERLKLDVTDADEAEEEEEEED